LPYSQPICIELIINLKGFIRAGDSSYWKQEMELILKRYRGATLVGLMLCASAISSAANAQNNGCALVGMLNSKAKAACEAASRAVSQASVANPIAGALPAGLEVGASNLTRPGPVPQGMQRIEIVKGGLLVDVTSGYPSGYGPAWSIFTDKPPTLNLNTFNHMVSYGAQGQANVTVRIMEDAGRPVLAFTLRGYPTCLADIRRHPEKICACQL
jgi:hypothetical protein